MTSAKTAKSRLQFVIARDRAVCGGRRYGPGNHVIFEEPVTVAPGEIAIPGYDVKTDDAVIMIMPIGLPAGELK